MADQKIFKPENMAVDGPQKNFLEELNLPPQVEDFLLAWYKVLLIGAAAVLVAVLAYSFGSQYVSSREERAAEQLAQAMRLDEEAKRAAALREVADDYRRTGAGVWGRLELAHLRRDDGDLQAAATAYEELLGSLSRRDPRHPMIRLSLAEVLRELGADDRAAEHYRQLAQTAGYEAWGLLGGARILERQGETAAAAEKYQQVVELANAPALLVEQAKQGR
ncbi:MAG: tetratricopeptide repeat protein [Desulfurivibrio sp.]|nr:tetratricopeptide repeat protein [Desulfurivibrio sp.]